MSVCAPIPQRDGAVVCVVEQPGDVLAFERTGQFQGPLPRAGRCAARRSTARIPRHLRDPPAARARCVRGATIKRRVILATNPNVAGEATALYLSTPARAARRPGDAHRARRADGLRSRILRTT